MNITNVVLKHAKEFLSNLHAGDSAAGLQRRWDDMIDALIKWTRQWGSCFPTFPVCRHATPRHATPRCAAPRHAHAAPRRAAPRRAAPRRAALHRAAPHPRTRLAAPRPRPQVKGGLEHILIKDTHDRLAAPKGRDMKCIMRILSIMADGMLKHLAVDEEDEEDEDEEDERADRRRELCDLIDSYNEYMELSRRDAPTGAPRHLVITP